MRGAGVHVTAWAPKIRQRYWRFLAILTKKHGAASNGFRIQRPIAQSSLVSVCSFQDRDSGDVAFAILIAVVVNHS